MSACRLSISHCCNAPDSKENQDIRRQYDSWGNGHLMALNRRLFQPRRHDIVPP